MTRRKATRPVPAARDMTDSQITAGCLALAVKLATAGPVPASIYDRSA